MFTDDQKIELEDGAKVLSVALDSRAIERMDTYASMLFAANESINLTRITPEDAVRLHFLDSLTIAQFTTFGKCQRVLDVGTGAGFPGLALAIAFLDTEFVLLDARRKRLLVLDDIIRNLGLTNVITMHGRAETACDVRMASAFDIVTARAVAKMEVLAQWMLPFVKPGGIAVAYKSQEAAAEIQMAVPAIRKLGANLKAVQSVSIPGDTIVRLLAIMEKSANLRSPNYNGSSTNIAEQPVRASKRRGR